MRLRALLATMVLIPTAALAGPLDGRWSLAAAPGQCARAADEPDSAATIRERRFNQYEAHCDWGPMASAGVGVWRAKGRCSVEGDETKGQFRFTRLGHRLDIRTPDGVTTRYHRCPARR